MKERESLCPLCGADLKAPGGGVATCSACPLSHGCALERCPRCGYQLVERSVLYDWITRLWRRGGDTRPCGGAP